MLSDLARILAALLLCSCPPAAPQSIGLHSMSSERTAIRGPGRCLRAAWVVRQTDIAIEAVVQECQRRRIGRRYDILHRLGRVRVCLVARDGGRSFAVLSDAEMVVQLGADHWRADKGLLVHEIAHLVRAAVVGHPDIGHRDRGWWRPKGIEAYAITTWLAMGGEQP